MTTMKVWYDEQARRVLWAIFVCVTYVVSCGGGNSKTIGEKLCDKLVECTPSTTSHWLEIDLPGQQYSCVQVGWENTHLTNTCYVYLDDALTQEQDPTSCVGSSICPPMGNFCSGVAAFMERCLALQTCSDVIACVGDVNDEPQTGGTNGFSGSGGVGGSRETGGSGGSSRSTGGSSGSTSTKPVVDCSEFSMPDCEAGTFSISIGNSCIQAGCHFDLGTCTTPDDFSSPTCECRCY